MKIRIFIFLTVLVFLSSKLLSEVTPEQLELLERLPPDQRESVMAKMETQNDLTEELEEVFDEEGGLIERPEKDEDSEEKCIECIYGYEIFKWSPTSFASVNNMPVPETYIVGPGDKVYIEYFGTEGLNDESYISREGQISLPKIGPLNVTGLTFLEMKDLIKKKVSMEFIGTSASVTLSELRSITVYILGEAYKPGAYTISGLSSVSNALFISGGVNENGSLRTIQVKRGGKVISTYDFYDLIVNGSTRTVDNKRERPSNQKYPSLDHC